MIKLFFKWAIYSTVFAVFVFLVVGCNVAYAEDSELTLFDSTGKATAYIAFDDEATIYLWDGKPVAYLENHTSDGFDVYGFNGKHLGWFKNGAIWDHTGNAVCADAKASPHTQFEPFKSFKQFKPFKSFTEFSPFQPFLSGRFGNMPCIALLYMGAR